MREGNLDGLDTEADRKNESMGPYFGPQNFVVGSCQNTEKQNSMYETLVTGTRCNEISLHLQSGKVLYLWLFRNVVILEFLKDHINVHI